MPDEPKKLRFTQRVNAEIESINSEAMALAPRRWDPSKYVVRPPREELKPGEKRPPWRPKELDEEEIIRALYDYLECTKVPILKEFTSSLFMCAEVLRRKADKNPNLGLAIRNALDKKEASLEQGMLYNKLNAIGSIFSLKQLGWKDYMDVNNRIEISQERKKVVDDLVGKILGSLPQSDKAD